MSSAASHENPILDEEGRPRRTILVVDDAPIFRDIETVFLGRVARIVTANDGPEALRIARLERPDLIVTDLSMGEMDGDDLCRHLRQDPALSGVPVMIVTSGRCAEEHERAVRAGADDVVEKPLNRVSLLLAVNRMMRSVERGLERVLLETDVRLSVEGDEIWGWSRNVSRGGIFVELDRLPEPGAELALEFRTPNAERHLQPTARIMWQRAAAEGLPPGMGLQFLKLEREEARWLEDYVYEMGDPIAQVSAALS